MRITIHGFEVVNDFAFVPDMVAGGEDVNAEIEQIFGQRGGDSKPRGRIFAVGEHQINAMLAHQILQAIADDCASGASENVSDEQSSHSFSMVTRRKSAFSSQVSALSFEIFGLFFVRA